MAFYDKSARMTFSVVLSLIIHAVLIGLLVGAQLFSDDAEKETSPTEARAPASEPPQELRKDAPSPAKPSDDARPAEPTRADKPAPLQTEPKDPFLADSPKARTKKPRRSQQPALKVARDKTSSAKPEVAKSDEPAKAEAESANDKSSSAETEIYVVKKGESLTSIARAYGCTLSELKTLNRNTLKKNNCLFVGAKIRVPKK